MPHLGAIEAIARRNTRDRHHAEDAVQETYLRAFAAFDRYRGDGMRSWLATICLNVLRESARRRATRPDEALGVDVPGSLDGEESFDAAVGREERLRLARALAGLSAEQREAIVLVDVAELTFQEAADVLGCPRGTVLARVHRGRRRLAQVLTSEEAAQ